MRYYDLQVANSSGTLTKHWTSHPNGLSNPPDAGALKVEIDAYNGSQTMPLPGSWVRVWGISLADIGQAADLNNKDLVVRGGMGKGLPLANPTQAGVLIQGRIQQAFANWIGTTMTLDLIVVAGSVAAGTGAAQNFVMNWPAKTKMSTALTNMLTPLFPSAKLNINISEQLQNSYNELHYIGTWGQLADYLLQQSRRILNTGPALVGQWNTPNNALSQYPGVQVHLDGKSINVFDGTTQAKAKQISLYDLVGQPTWIGPQTIQATCVMRGDINVGDFIKLPPTRAIVTSASLSSYSKQRQDLIFQGVFMVNKVHHVGNYKDPGPLSWVTVLDAAIQVQTDSAGQASIQTDPNPPLKPVAVGGTPPGTVTATITSMEPTPAPTAQDAGLTLSSPAPSGMFSGVVGGGFGGAGIIPPPASATSTTVGLKQSAPAPSLGQAITTNPGT